MSNAKQVAHSLRMRGDETVDQPDPKFIEETIDEACEILAAVGDGSELTNANKTEKFAIVNRPTPETDAALLSSDCGYGCGHAFYYSNVSPSKDVAFGNENIVVLADFAHKLERERDEAREAFTVATDQLVQTQSKLREGERERDKNAADAASLAARLTALELKSADELARLERERDEAREDAKEAKRLILQYKQLLHDWSKEATK